MNNIMDYLDWRGDIGFDQDGLNEVDNLIFSMVAYLNFDMIKGAQTIEEASKAYKDSKKRGTSKESRDFIKKIERLLDKLAKTQRYRGVTISDYMYKYDHDNESQFCAMTFSLGDWIYVAYRGTDESLVGFKEDFNMCFSAPVMAQKDAVAYLRQVLNKYRDQEVYTGGHSKGGNLAVYSHVGIDGEYRKRIVKIFNNDGPGFTEEILKTPAYRETTKKVIKLLPHGSVVGILMDDEEEYYETEEDDDIEKIHNLLKIAWDKYQDDEGYVNVSSAGQFIKRVRPGFVVRTFGFLKVCKTPLGCAFSAHPFLVTSSTFILF